MKSKAGEIALSAICAALGGGVYWSAAQIPPSLMSQISAGLVPRVVAVALMFLALLHPITVLRRARLSQRGVESGRVSGDARPAPKTHLIWLVSTFLFGFLMIVELELLPFWLAGFLFCFLSILMLSDLNWRAILFAAGISGGSILVTIVVFTQVFTVILP